ncbi:MAG: oxidoreductase [Herbinix sp.]|jgi:predicted dehydrogenase|nr:oxidoreductase [Herbinix sp.]
MKLLQIGLGEFGMSWFTDIVLKCVEIDRVVLVDLSETKLEEAKRADRDNRCVFYQSLEEAMVEKPDIVLNITPPHLHRTIIEQMIEEGIPVLSEKPIALKYEDAKAILDLSNTLSVPVMIAENYRYTALAREVRRLLINNEIGKIGSVEISFYRNHFMKNYHKDLAEPLLMDVAIHHMDLLRYFTKEEVIDVKAVSYNPWWSWYRGNASVSMNLRMTGGVVVSYCGSLASKKNEDDWNATWRIEGDHGILRIKNSEIYIENELGERMIPVEETVDSRSFVLKEFLLSLKEKRKGETDIQDNIKTYTIVHNAVQVED